MHVIPGKYLLWTVLGRSCFTWDIDRVLLGVSTRMVWLRGNPVIRCSLATLYTYCVYSPMVDLVTWESQGGSIVIQQHPDMV